MTWIMWILIVLFFVGVAYDWLWLAVTAFVLLILLILSALDQRWNF